MAEETFPWSGQTITEAQYRRLMRLPLPARVVTGLTVTAVTGGLRVSAGSCVVDGHMLTLTAAETVTPPSGHGGALAMVVARLTPTATTTAGKLTLAVITGTESTTPTPTQSATGVWELPLASFTLDSTGTTATGDITDLRGDTASWSQNALDFEGGRAIARTDSAHTFTGSKLTVGASGRVLIEVDGLAWCEADNVSVHTTVNLIRSGQTGTGDTIRDTRRHTLGHGPCFLPVHLTGVATATPGETVYPVAAVSVESTSGGDITLQHIDTIAIAI